MSKQLIQSYPLGPVSILYFMETESQIVGFTVIPQQLEEKFTLLGDWKIESLVQLKAVGDDYPIGLANGHSLRNSGTCWKLKFEKQVNTTEGNDIKITTTVASDCLRANHIVTFHKGEEGIHIQTTLENIGIISRKIEMLSSFSLCNIFPFEEQERTGDYQLHRLQSVRSKEGCLLTQSMYELQLEPSWQKYGAQSISYGQVGTMPVRNYFPWMVLEDTKYHCFIGASIAWGGSWQIEVFGEDDRLAVSGGLADREFGHWMKELAPGEMLQTPDAFLTACTGKLDQICNQLTSRSRKVLEEIPDLEKDMPILFNEFCTTWGEPSEEKICRMAKILKGKGCTYFIINAGWHSNQAKGWEENMGDWIVDSVKFPNGLKRAADIIRDCGMHPGICFNIETIGKDAAIYQKEEWQLQRDGYPISTVKRRFFDLRNQEVIEYLKLKLIGTLRECGFEYLKIDYNDTIGIGCDGAESLGEGLRQQVLAATQFFKDIRNEFPELTMENCSSGGHRLEPSFMEIFNIASCSDAHECVPLPIIAANVHRAIQPEQSQIWAVLRNGDSVQRMGYSLLSTFLGRMCLSGDIYDLDEAQWTIVDKAIRFYHQISDIIRYGESYRYGSSVLSYARPIGYQILVRKQAEKAFLVVHTFLQQEDSTDRPLEKHNVIIEFIPELIKMDIIETISVNPIRVNLSKDELSIIGLQGMDACAILLENTNKVESQ